MNKKLFEIFIIVLCLFILIELLIKKSLIYSSVIYAINMWVNNLIPALFPFFIISDILINLNFKRFIPKFIKNICKSLFKITDNMFVVLILSMVSGFPSNARNTRILYDNKMIDLNEANHILMFSHFANPVFILTTVGGYFFHNEKWGLIILFSHYFSNFILGIFLRGRFRHTDNVVLDDMNNNYNIGKIFVLAIKRGIDTILLICGIVVIFLMLSSIIINIFDFNLYNSMIIKGLFEITIGIEALSKLNISNIYKVVIASCFLSFGGISVHMQVISQITDTNIKYSYFFVGRVLQMIISGLITFILSVTI